jgi:ATP-dependent Clp protease ATP-binding subunit ClpA
MFERFTERARQVVVLAQEEARAANLGYIGTEHVLLGLLREEEGVAAKVLNDLGVTADKVRASAERRYMGGDEPRADGKLPFTPRAKKVLEMSLREALSLGHNYIGTEHILLGLVRDEGNIALEILQDDFLLTCEKIRDEVIRMLSGKKAPILHNKENKPAVLRDGSILKIEEVPDFVHVNKTRALMALAVTLGRQHPGSSVENIVNAAVALGAE